MLGEEAQPAALHPSSHRFFLFLFIFLFLCGGVASVEGTDIRTENEPEGWEKSLDGREQKHRLWCSQGAWRGPGGAPYSRQGRGKVEGGMGDVRCYRTFLPYLRRLPATQPQAPPHLSLHTPRATHAGQPT